MTDKAAKGNVFLNTYGCQMNVLDSELVQGQLEALGYQFVKQADEADVVLLNTCSVREQSEHKVWSALGRLEILKKNPSGEDVVIDTVGRGESVGEMAVLQETKRSASVIAITDCTLLVLTAKGFNLLLAEHPRVAASLLRSLAILLSKQLRETSSDLVDLM